MKTEANEQHDPTRRDFLKHSITAGAALSFPWVVPARALGRDGAVAPSERITLGVTGIGPRCTYDLRSMLGEKDVQCVAIADVQASRRAAGKSLVDGTTGRRIARFTATCASCSRGRRSTRS